MEKNVPYLCCLVVALVTITFAPRGVAQNSPGLGVEYVVMDDGRGGTLFIGSAVVAPVGTPDVYTPVFDYQSGLDRLNFLQDMGCQVSIYNNAGLCIDHSLACKDQF